IRRVLVREKKSSASGGTGRSVGIIRQLYPTRETSEMVLRSLAVFERFGEAVAGASGFVRSRVLIGVLPARQRAVGARPESGGPAELPRIEPRIDPTGLGALL